MIVVKIFLVLVLSSGPFSQIANNNHLKADHQHWVKQGFQGFEIVKLQPLYGIVPKGVVAISNLEQPAPFFAGAITNYFLIEKTWQWLKQEEATRGIELKRMAYAVNQKSFRLFH